MRASGPVLLSLLVMIAAIAWLLLAAPFVPVAAGDPQASGTAPAAAGAAAPADAEGVGAPAAGPAPGSGRHAVIADGATLRGTVIGPDGSPVAGAAVTAECSEVDEYALLDGERMQRRQRVADAATDDEGAFVLAVRPGRHHLVRVAAAGFAPAARVGCVADARVDFRLAWAAALAGTVRDEAGRAVPGTRIVVRQRLPLRPLVVGEATSDAAGAFRVDGLPAGEADVEVAPVVLAAPRDAGVTLVAGATARHDVVLLVGMTIRGHVRDAVSRAGIAGATVGEGRRGRSVRSSSDGAFELVGFAPHHNLTLRAAADGYPEREVLLRGRGSGPDDTRNDVEVLLARGFAARGRVVDARGLPLGGVYVAGAAADHGGEGDSFRSDWCATTSAADGTFVVAPLRADMAHELLLIHAGFATAVYAFPSTTGAAADVDFGDVALLAPSSLRGAVVDEHGAPVVDQEVELAGHNADRWRLAAAPADGYRALDGYVATRRGLTDDRGRFHFADLAAGSYEVRAPRPDSHERVRVPLAVPAAGEVTGVLLRVFRGLAIAGQVFVSDGGALPKCYCSIDPEDGQPTSGDVEVGADGRFHAGGLQPGYYKLSLYPYASDADRAAGRIFVAREVRNVAAGSQALRVELPVQAMVGGTVVDAAQVPVRDAIVLVRDGDRTVEFSATDALGRFQIPAPVQRPLRVFVLPQAPAPGAAVDTAAALVAADTMAGAPPLLLVLPSR